MANKFNRIQVLIGLLRSHPQGMGLSQLASSLQVDSRTIKRYISDLRKSGYPVLDLRSASNEPSRFYLSPEFSPPKALIESLEKIKADLHAWGNPKYVHNISAAIEFLEQLGNNGKKQNPISNPESKTSVYHIDHGPFSEQDVSSQLLASLEKAIQLSQKLNLSYKAAGEKPSQIVFSPYKLSLRVGRLYLIGEDDSEPNVFKSLSIKRIKRCQTISETFVPKNFRPEDYYKFCFGQFPRQAHERPEKIQLLIKSGWVKSILEESHFNPPGKFITGKKGEIFEFLAIVKPDLLNWVFSLLPHALPLGPLSLCVEVKNRLKQAESLVN